MLTLSLHESWNIEPLKEVPGSRGRWRRSDINHQKHLLPSPALKALCDFSAHLWIFNPLSTLILLCLRPSYLEVRIWNKLHFLSNKCLTSELSHFKTPSQCHVSFFFNYSIRKLGNRELILSFRFMQRICERSKISTKVCLQVLWPYAMADYFLFLCGTIDWFQIGNMPRLYVVTLLI